MIGRDKRSSLFSQRKNIYNIGILTILFGQNQFKKKTFHYLHRRSFKRRLRRLFQLAIQQKNAILVTKNGILKAN